MDSEFERIVLKLGAGVSIETQQHLGTFGYVGILIEDIQACQTFVSPARIHILNPIPKDFKENADQYIDNPPNF